MLATLFESLKEAIVALHPGAKGPPYVLTSGKDWQVEWEVLKSWLPQGNVERPFLRDVKEEDRGLCWPAMRGLDITVAPVLGNANRDQKSRINKVASAVWEHLEVWMPVTQRLVSNPGPWHSFRKKVEMAWGERKHGWVVNLPGHDRSLMWDGLRAPKGESDPPNTPPAPLLHVAVPMPRQTAKRRSREALSPEMHAPSPSHDDAGAEGNLEPSEDEDPDMTVGHMNTATRNAQATCESHTFPPSPSVVFLSRKRRLNLHLFMFFG